jgi:hypothetical protein
MEADRSDELAAQIKADWLNSLSRKFGGEKFWPKLAIDSKYIHYYGGSGQVVLRGWKLDQKGSTWRSRSVRC